MRYLAIDFETANAKRSSICAFGYAMFEDGKVVAQGAELCRPIPNYYDPWNIKIHGITPDQTDLLDGFEAHIDTIERFAPEFIVAHNASFDISCIRHWCDQTGRLYPEYPYICTLITSRILHPGISHTLGIMSHIYGIDLNHHEAGSDALACGLLLHKALEQTEARSVRELCKKLNIRLGRLYQDDYTSCICKVSTHEPSCHEKISNICCAVDEDITEASPLNGAHICFTGALTCASRADAALKAAKRGAIPQDTVTSKTNFLVVGFSDFIDLDSGKKTSKMKKAEELKLKGQNITIISEDEFLDLIHQ